MRRNPAKHFLSLIAFASVMLSPLATGEFHPEGPSEAIDLSATKEFSLGITGPRSIGFGFSFLLAGGSILSLVFAWRVANYKIGIEHSSHDDEPPPRGLGSPVHAEKQIQEIDSSATKTSTSINEKVSLSVDQRINYQSDLSFVDFYIEIVKSLKGGASAFYGSDAVARVAGGISAS